MGFDVYSQHINKMEIYFSRAQQLRARYVLARIQYTHKCLCVSKPDAWFDKKFMRYEFRAVSPSFVDLILFTFFYVLYIFAEPFDKVM